MSAAARRELVMVLGALAIVAAWGAFAGGAGFVNGDAAAYLAQVDAGDLGQRQVHLGYLALAVGLRDLAPAGGLERWMDGLSIAGAALGVVGAAASVRSGRGSPGLAALGTAAVLLPIAAHAEVDPLWIAAVIWTRVLPPWLASVVFAAAVTVSPVALLAGPWAASGERDRLRWIAGGAVAAVLGLTAWSQGDWWIGDRGVLASGPPRPWRAIRAWVPLLPWALLPLAVVSDGEGAGVEVATWAPLVLAPPDVPAWAVPAVGFVLFAARGGLLVPPPVVALAIGIELTIGGFVADDRRQQVIREDRVVRELAADLGDGGLIAPFTWGARVAVRASGDPYGVRWRPPEGFLRDQAQSWCGSPPRRVFRLPPVDGEPERLDPTDPAIVADCG